MRGAKGRPRKRVCRKSNQVPAGDYKSEDIGDGNEEEEEDDDDDANCVGVTSTNLEVTEVGAEHATAVNQLAGVTTAGKSHALLHDVRTYFNVFTS